VTKQSILSMRGEMDCFAPLAMTMLCRHTFTFPRRDTPESCKTFRPKGRGECRVPAAPAASRAK